MCEVHIAVAVSAVSRYPHKGATWLALTSKEKITSGGGSGRTSGALWINQSILFSLWDLPEVLQLFGNKDRSHLAIACERIFALILK